MKKVTSFIVFAVLTVSVFAQSPEKMSYQAVIRDASNILVTNASVGMQISILQGGSTGTAVYVELQFPTSNANGLVSLEIGSGAVVSGDFTTIDWGSDTYFIKTETDPTGGASYTITGTSQLLSVPYALHAKTAENFSGTITETDPVFGGSVAGGISGTDTANWNNHTVDTDTQLDSAGVTALGFASGAHTVDTDTQLDSAGIAALGYVAGIVTEADPIYGASVAGGITGSDTSNWNNKLDSYTETDPIYGASVAGGITGTDTTNWNNKLDSYTETDPIYGASVAGGITGSDTTNWNTETDPVYGASVAGGITGSDTTNWNNKLDSYTETDPIYGASVAGGITGSDTTNWNNKLAVELDGDSTNELQAISFSNDTLYLSNGGSVYFPYNPPQPLSSDDGTFTCGDQFTDDRDGQTYNTVLIGSQCWMAENLNIGVLLPAGSNASNDGVIEKYCIGTEVPGDLSGYCNIGGGLYQWDEMMQYDTIEDSQGICPTGWHIPSDTSWCALEFSIEPGADPTCSTIGFRGGTLRVALSVGGSSGFEAIYVGQRFFGDGLFYTQGTGTLFWTSTQSGANAWHRQLSVGGGMRRDKINNKQSGFSVRCVQD